MSRAISRQKETICCQVAKESGHQISCGQYRASLLLQCNEARRKKPLTSACVARGSMVRCIIRVTIRRDPRVRRRIWFAVGRAQKISFAMLSNTAIVRRHAVNPVINFSGTTPLVAALWYDAVLIDRGRP